MKKIITGIFLLLSLLAQAQKEKVEAYIYAYKEIAITEMLRSGVPASIKLAQGIYWYTGAVTYQGASILMLIYFTHLQQLRDNTQQQLAHRDTLSYFSHQQQPAHTATAR